MNAASLAVPVGDLFACPFVQNSSIFHVRLRDLYQVVTLIFCQKVSITAEDERARETSASIHAMTRAELNLAALPNVWAFSLLAEAAGHPYRKARGLQLRCSICSDGEPSASLYLHAIDMRISGLLWPRWVRAVK